MARELIDLTLFLHMETKPGRHDEGAIRPQGIHCPIQLAFNFGQSGMTLRH